MAEIDRSLGVAVMPRLNGLTTEQVPTIIGLITDQFQTNIGQQMESRRNGLHQCQYWPTVEIQTKRTEFRLISGEYWPTAEIQTTWTDSGTILANSRNYNQYWPVAEIQTKRTELRPILANIWNSDWRPEFRLISDQHNELFPSKFNMFWSIMYTSQMIPLVGRLTS